MKDSGDTTAKAQKQQTTANEQRNKGRKEVEKEGSNKGFLLLLGAILHPIMPMQWHRNSPNSGGIIVIE